MLVQLLIAVNGNNSYMYFQMLFAVMEGEIQTLNRALGQIQQQQNKTKFKTTQN